MSIESDLKRLADAAEGILAYLTNTVVEKRGPGRPRKTETVDPAPEAPESEVVSSTAAAAETKAAIEKAQTASATAAPASETITVEMLKERNKAILSAGKRDALLALVKKHGGESASTIPEANRAAFYKEAGALL